MSGNLIQARVRVAWGKINLSAYDGELNFPKGHPLVYDVEVNLQSESEGPTGTMSWDPTGPGMEVYESFLSKKELMASQIVVEFFYPNGKTLPLYYVWSGQTISYGNDMKVTVKLQSELAGLVNANIRNIAQVATTNKGFNGVEAINNAQKQFGLDDKKYNNLIQYETVAQKGLEKLKLQTNYAKDSTLGAQLANITQQTGNTTMAHNIGGAGIVVFGPYSYGKQQEVKNGVTDIAAGEFPNPKIRYGYLIGPSMMSSLNRTFNYQPPQQTNSNTPNTQTKALPPRDQYGRFTKDAPSAPQKQQVETLKPTQAPVGTSNGRSTPGIGNQDNPEQVPKQNALNQEKSSTLDMTTYCVPALMGVKANDILFIPSLKGDYVEDWIVQSVGYNQTDGKIDVSIQATRVNGAGTPMNQQEGKKFLDFAKANGLIGPNATLEAWDKYAWNLPGSSGTGLTRETEEQYYNRVYGEA